ncbi:hypothetical protein LY76DRAFT_649656 [Colletotrichum caudatum]|nr:hypothetical protein LY76DRAFT_649656 [Colletotrichum caudatum]
MDFQGHVKNLLSTGTYDITSALFEAVLLTKCYDQLPQELEGRFKEYCAKAADGDTTNSSPSQKSGREDPPPSPSASRPNSLLSHRNTSRRPRLSALSAPSLDLSDVTNLPLDESQVDPRALHHKGIQHWDSFQAWKRDQEQRRVQSQPRQPRGEAAAAAAEAAYRRHLLHPSPFETPRRPRRGLGAELTSSPPPPPLLPSPVPNPTPARPFVLGATTPPHTTPLQVLRETEYKRLRSEFDTEMIQYQEDWKMFKKAEEEANRCRGLVGERNLGLIQLLMRIEAVFEEEEEEEEEEGEESESPVESHRRSGEERGRRCGNTARAATRSGDAALQGLSSPGAGGPSANANRAGETGQEHWWFHGYQPDGTRKPRRRGQGGSKNKGAWNSDA